VATSLPRSHLDPLGLLDDVKGLVSPPIVYTRVAELMQSPDSGAKDFAEVIASDPNLTARLLRIANGSFYGFRSRVDTVSRAVAVIGTRDLYNLVLGLSAVQSFSRISSEIVNMDTFWRHSVFSGLLARSIAKRCDVLHPERVFVAGMLHDIGSLILFHRLPDVARDLLLVADGDEAVLHDVELDALGFSHAHVGGLLLDNWHVPASLHQSVSAHHDPSAASGGDTDAAIIHTADILANTSDLGAIYDGERETIEQAVERCHAFDLRAHHLDAHALVGEAGLQFGDTVAALGLKRA
jgi:HD-like signal output (HDOD) protein